MIELFARVRQTGRTLLKAPLSSALVAAVLALGVGAAATLFTVVDSLLLSPLPYPEPDRLVRVYETFPYPGGQGWGSVSVPNFRDWREGSSAFAELAAYSWASRNLGGAGEPERVRTVAATAGLFEVTGVAPVLGRAFTAAEERSGGRVAVLSHELWRSRYGGDPGLVGGTIDLDGEAHTVLGVMPEGFEFPPGWGSADAWLPLRLTPEQEAARGSHWMAVAGRLAPGATLERAEAEIEGIAARLAEEYPEQEGRSALLVPLREDVVGWVRPSILLLFGGTGLVLLIACANAAGLLLVRAAGRQREVAIRSALGAGRRHLAGQLLTEASLLAAAAAAGGLALAYAGVRLLVRLAGTSMPRAAEVALDARAVGFVVAVSALVTLALGLVPALQSASGRLGELLKEAGSSVSLSRRGQRVRAWLVASQIALSMVLLVGSGLLLRTLVALLGTDTGLSAENVLTLKISVPEARYAAAESAAALLEPVREEVEALPGVRSAAWINLLPLDRWGSNGNFQIAGRPAPERLEDAPFAEFRVVSPGYFETLGIPLLRGRAVAAEDRDPERPVAVVNRSLAETYFSGGEAVGERLVLDGTEAPIVGVVGDVRSATLDREPSPEIYFPYSVASLRDMTLVVRAELPPEELAGAVTGVIHRADPGQAVYAVQSFERVLEGSLAQRRLYLWILAVFAVAALVLAAAGLFGVVSSAVTHRKREIGIRVALGARPASVVGLMVREGALLALLGLAGGTAASLALGRLLASQLYGVTAADPATFAGVGALLLGVALAASYAPARRALAVDPVETLRTE